MISAVGTDPKLIGSSNVSESMYRRGVASVDIVAMDFNPLNNVNNLIISAVGTDHNYFKWQIHIIRFIYRRCLQLNIEKL